MSAFRSASVVNVPKVGEDVAVTTSSQLLARPFVCVSYDEEERIYQPLRVAGALVLGPALLYSSSKIPSDNGALRFLTAAAGIWMVAYNSLRHYEVSTEMDRYLSTRDSA